MNQDHNIQSRQHLIKKLQDNKRKDPLSYFQDLKSQSSSKPLTPPEDGECLTPIEWVVGLGLKVIEEDAGAFLSPDSVKDSELLSTTDQVKKLIENFYRNEINDFGDYIGNVNTELAEKICRWGLEYFQQGESPYEKKCMELYHTGSLSISKVGTIISSIPIYFYSRKLDETVKDSEYIGKVSQSVADNLFLKVMEYDKGEESESGRLKCRDRDGNFFVFYTKNKTIEEHLIEVGDCFTLEAKIKDHVESPYDRDLEGNRIRINKLNYVKVVKNYGKPK